MEDKNIKVILGLLKVCPSLTNNLGTNGFACRPKHGSGYSEKIKVLSIVPASNPGRLGGPSVFDGRYNNTFF